MNDLWFALAKLTRLFASLGIDYAVMGALGARLGALDALEAKLGEYGHK